MRPIVVTLRVLFRFVALVMLSAGCASGPVRMPTGLPLRIGPEDELLVRIGADEPFRLRVAHDGAIFESRIGVVSAAGLTADELAAAIASRLAPPAKKVSVVISSSAGAFVYVFGEVAKPGRYPYRRGMTLLDAISLAGGHDRFRASLSVSLVRSPPSSRPVASKVNLGRILDGDPRVSDPSLEPGDIIYVPTSLMTRVADAVTYVLQPITSLINAIVGGISAGAAAATAP